MSITVIVLVILVILLLYFLYVYFVKKSNTLTKSANLNSKNPDYTTLNSGQSTRYAYGIWVFINTWNTTTDKIVFSRKDNIKLYLDKTKPQLYCDITQNPASSDNKPIAVTDNFPVQKWTLVVISADGQIIDCYIDGKLVTSTKLSNAPNPPSDAATSPAILGTGWDCYVAGFTNWSGPVGPQEVWDTYIQGNGSALSQYFGNYGMTLTVSKNNVEKSKYTVF
jgi:hypothetical protein